jgi:hypothetical protein
LALGSFPQLAVSLPLKSLKGYLALLLNFTPFPSMKKGWSTKVDETTEQLQFLFKLSFLNVTFNKAASEAYGPKA